jgi:hypothetical protein
VCFHPRYEGCLHPRLVWEAMTFATQCRLH